MEIAGEIQILGILDVGFLSLSEVVYGFRDQLQIYPCPHILPVTNPRPSAMCQKCQRSQRLSDKDGG
jgi:hypothetical protein